MQLTAAYLDEQIASLDRQFHQALAQANAYDGARQLARQLRARLDEPEPPPAGETPSQPESGDT